MKKIIAFILVVACLALTACSSANAISLHETLPWSIENSALKEQCTYRVVRYLGNGDKAGAEEGDPDKPLVLTQAQSYITYTMWEGWSVRFNENGALVPYQDLTAGKEGNTRSSTLLTMNLSVWYLNESYVPQLYHLLSGAPETINSCAVFDRYTLAAKFTYRETNLAHAPGDDLNHKMWVDYTGDVLGKRVARIQYAPYTSDVKESSVKSGEYYDNEYLYYYARALKSTDGGAAGSQTIKFTLPYENLLKGKKVKTRSLVATTTADDAALPYAGFSDAEFNSVYDLFNLDSMSAEQKADDENKYKIAACSSLELNEKKSGPPVIVYYSRYPIRENREKSLQSMSKVLLQIRTYSYGGSVTLENGTTYKDPQKLEYTQVFALKDYLQGRVADPGFMF